MKVLFVQLYNGRKEPAIFPIGLCSIATVLKDHEIDIYDPNISEDPYRDLEDRLRRFRPDIVGISIRNIDSVTYSDIFYYYKELTPTIRVVKSVLQESIIFAGGAGFSLYPEKIMERHPDIDFGIHLEGEESTEELLGNLDNYQKVKGIFYRDASGIVFTGNRPKTDMSRLPIPRRDFIEIEKYYRFPFSIGIETKRGCSLTCAYCTYPYLNGRQVRVRSPKAVVDEIEYLIENFKIPNLIFTDSVFNVPLGHSVEICNEILRRKIIIDWLAYFNERNLNEEYVKLVLSAGCLGFSFSPDGFSDRTLKGLGKNITHNDILKGYRLVKKVKGATASYNFFINPPRQDLKGVFGLFFFYLRTRFLNRSKFHSFTLNHPRIEANTRLFESAIREGVISKDTELLPPRIEELSNLFYINRSNRLVNKLFDILVALKKLKNRYKQEVN